MTEAKEKFVCEYCGKVVSSQMYLLRHQKQAMSCLKLQNKKPEKLDCPWCKKHTYYNRTSYLNHVRVCDEKKLIDIKQKAQEFEAENLSQKAQIASLQAKITQLECELKEAHNKFILLQDRR